MNVETHSKLVTISGGKLFFQELFVVRDDILIKGIVGSTRVEKSKIDKIFDFLVLDSKQVLKPLQISLRKR